MEKNKYVFDHFQINQQLAQIKFNELNNKSVDDLVIFGKRVTKTTEKGVERVDPFDVESTQPR